MLPAWISAAADAAAAGSPMTVARTAGRHLLADGDALAYYCAGTDDTSPAQARTNLRTFLRACTASSGAEHTRVLVTGRGSHKGYRYAVAKAKPYQGQRSGSRRPKNWEFLREVIEGGDSGFPTEVTQVAEADDLFGKYSSELGYENVVVLTQDKDMRMVPGWHMDWKERTLVLVAPDTFELWHNEKCYGRKWFWLQMLHGDTADNIPGLPKYINEKGNAALCGEKTALKLLADCKTNDEARATVFGLYEGYYGQGWQEHLLEQAVLLWMRNDKESRVLNVTSAGNPLAFGERGPNDAWADALVRIKLRVSEASA